MAITLPYISGLLCLFAWLAAYGASYKLYRRVSPLLWRKADSPRARTRALWLQRIMLLSGAGFVACATALYQADVWWLIVAYRDSAWMSWLFQVILACPWAVPLWFAFEWAVELEVLPRLGLTPRRFKLELKRLLGKA